MSSSEAPSICLKSGSLAAEIQAGELIRFSCKGHQFIHRAGEPGWGHSDTEMFPVIGPTAQMGYRVQVPKGNAIQDQHGLLRELPYTLESRGQAEARFVKTYTAGDLVANSKYPERSAMRWLIWPYSFSFTKQFRLTETHLEVRFEVSGDRDMPYMLGYHPAFRLTREDAHLRISEETTIGLKEILEVGDRALHLPECNRVVLQDTAGLEIETEGFGQFMLWSPDPAMVCVEPITFYPYDAPPGQLHEGFRYLEGEPVHFRCRLRPLMP
ncbi:aldose 1-epimerase [Robiginitalea sediminis]|uniref:aldose 1-epimerase n=1 Tax=Robiginitalea sediminis TaxID=1982593 RepID=UPI000B4AD089|nr:aldose 1-epimerase [Robiginitalea sediminis]